LFMSGRQMSGMDVLGWNEGGEGAAVAVSAVRPQFMGMGGTDSCAFLYTDSHMRQKGKMWVLMSPIICIPP
jgi:hypothetical protein